MPYASNAELPPGVRSRYSDHCQSVFRRVFNETSGDEAMKFRVAHTAAKKCMTSKALKTALDALDELSRQLRQG